MEHIHLCHAAAAPVGRSSGRREPLPPAGRDPLPPPNVGGEGAPLARPADRLGRRLRSEDTNFATVSRRAGGKICFA